MKKLKKKFKKKLKSRLKRIDLKLNLNSRLKHLKKIYPDLEEKKKIWTNLNFNTPNKDLPSGIICILSLEYS
jgi:hypothetical protein